MSNVLEKDFVVSDKDVWDELLKDLGEASVDRDKNLESRIQQLIKLRNAVGSIYSLLCDTVVYVGDVRREEVKVKRREDYICPKCEALITREIGYDIDEYLDYCPNCDCKLIWEG